MSEEEMEGKEMTDEEYRETLKRIFQNMDSRKLCYYYHYIIEYEKE